MHTNVSGGFQASNTDLSLLLSSETKDRATALDLPLDLTIFRNVGAKSKRDSRLTLRELQTLLPGTNAPNKSELPLIKLATFGDVPTIEGSLRHDVNLQSLSGVEGDYDSGKISPEEGANRLRQAGVAALVYTTPSHTSEAPRWRVLAPLAKAIAPSERHALCARLNGALGGILANESFTASQSYYFGTVAGAKGQSFLIDGQPLDRVAGLTSISPRSKPEKSSTNLTSLLSTPKPVDWPEVQRALGYITADCPRDDWRNVGMALHHASDGAAAGFDLWCDWSRTALPLNVASDRELKGQWRSFGRGADHNTITIGTLFHLAGQHGYERPRIGITADDFCDLPDLPATPTPKTSRLTFLSPAECKAAPSRGYLIKGLFAPGDVGCVFGAPGAGKSLIAPFLGYAVAQGREAFGMRTRAGGVFYVAAEDPTGMRGRVRALEAAHGDAPAFKLVEGVSDLLMTESPDLAALVEVVKAERPALIFIDTLALAFPGLEENDAKAMGRVVAVARRLAKWGAAVILIHHDTKAEGATPRGHSLLNGALDVALHVKRDEGGIIRGKLTKNRNGTCDRDIAFCIAIENGGTDDDGDTITLPRCNALIGSPAKTMRLPPQADAALRILEGMSQPVSKDDWKRACMESDAVCPNDKPDTRRKAFDRALATLTRADWITSHDGFYSIRDGFDDLDGHGQSPDIFGMSTKDKDTVARDGQGHTP